jgi:excisionase family DNA binding protein
MNQLLSVEDAACRLAISPWTLRGLLRAGKLNPVRIGRRILVSESDLERFIEESTRTVRPLHQ